MSDRTSVETLPAAWRRQAKALRRYGGETPAVALDSCAAELEATLIEKDEITFSLTEAARESGYSADHLGRLVRDGKIPNAGRPGAPRIVRSHLPRKTQAPATPRLVEKHRRGEVSNAQIVQSIIEEESNDGTHETYPAQLRRRRMGPEPGTGLSRSQDRPVPDQRAGWNIGGTHWTFPDHSPQAGSQLLTTVCLITTVLYRSLRSQSIPCTIDCRRCNGKSYTESRDTPSNTPRNPSAPHS